MAGQPGMHWQGSVGRAQRLTPELAWQHRNWLLGLAGAMAFVHQGVMGHMLSAWQGHAWVIAQDQCANGSAGSN